MHLMVRRSEIFGSLLLLAALACHRATERELKVAVRIFGGPGKSDGRFVTPRGVSVAGDHLLVVDRSGRVQELSLEGTFRRSIEVVSGKVGFPIGVVADPSGGFVLCDTHNSRVRFFGPDWHETAVLGHYGPAPGEFTYPQHAARDDQGNLYVTEYGDGPANRVQVFDPKNRLLRTFGSYGTGPGHFTRAMGIAIYRDEAFVADVSDRILVFGLDGTFHRQFGTSGSGRGELRYPYGLCFVGDTLYVCEHANHRIQRFDAHGVSGGWFGEAGSGPGQFSGPWDICADRKGNLYVCDTGNHRVVAFDPDHVAWMSGSP